MTNRSRSTLIVAVAILIAPPIASLRAAAPSNAGEYRELLKTRGAPGEKTYRVVTGPRLARQ